MHQVRVRLEHELRPGAREQGDPGLVRLGPRREEQRVVLAEQLGDALLEATGGGVAVQDVVAHLGLGHGTAHRGRRPRHSVAAQVNRPGRGHPSCTRCERCMRIRSYVSATSPPKRNR